MTEDFISAPLLCSGAELKGGNAHTMAALMRQVKTRPITGGVCGLRPIDGHCMIAFPKSRTFRVHLVEIR